MLVVGGVDLDNYPGANGFIVFEDGKVFTSVEFAGEVIMANNDDVAVGHVSGVDIFTVVVSKLGGALLVAVVEVDDGPVRVS